MSTASEITATCDGPAMLFELVREAACLAGRRLDPPDVRDASVPLAPTLAPTPTQDEPWQLRELPGDATAGDLVVAVACDTLDGVARFRERLAQAGTTSAEFLSVALACGVRPAFPEAVLDATAAWRADDGIADPALQDLTALPFVTIDNVTSRDLDQAMHLEPTRLADGLPATLIRYALADASFYVRTDHPAGKVLFDEALARGSSYYLPGMAIPMLPRGLSEDLVSLNEGVDRRALVFEMTIDAEGACHHTRVLRARIRSRRKLSYIAVQRHYSGSDHGAQAGQPWTETLDLLAEVGERLLARTKQRDVVSFDRVEVDVRQLDPLGYRFTMLASHRLQVERYNEQISLLCNVEGARILADGHDDPDLQAVFRVHPAPPEVRLDKLARRIRTIVKCQDLDPVWRWNRKRESLAQYLERLGQQDAPPRFRRAVAHQALITNERSFFSAEPDQHFGIGAAAYARFSSPMREIVGIFTHKELLEHLHLEAPLDRTEDDALRERVLEAGNSAKALQHKVTKAANKLVLDRLFEYDLASTPTIQRRGTVTGIHTTRAYVQLDEPPIEVKVHVEALEAMTATPWKVCSDSVELVPDDASKGHTIRIGDVVTIEVDSYDPRKERWVFKLLEALPQARMSPRFT